jgi:plastocyanin
MRRFYLALLPLLALPAAIPSEAAPSGGTVTGTVAVFDKAKPTKADVWVYLLPVVPKGKKAPPPKPTYARISQFNQKFVPDRVVVPVGSTIAFPNDEPSNIEHNVFSPTPPFFDLSRYGPKKSKPKQFLDAGEFEIYCDIHQKMNARVKVIESNYYVKAKDGAFTIPNVPAGTYTVIAWAPDSDESTEGPITVVDGGNATVPHVLKVHLGPAKPPHNHLNGQPYDPRCAQYPNDSKCK